MSTGCECVFIEIERGKWYYLLEDYDAPKNAWDWRDHARAYGPFPTEEKAQADLHAGHANPGSYWSQPLPEGTDAVDLSKDETLAKLIKGATKAAAAIRGIGWPRFPGG